MYIAVADFPSAKYGEVTVQHA